jgi:transposase
MFVESVDRIIPRQFEIFIGLDVDKASYHVTAMSGAGIVRQLRLPAQPAGLVRWVGRQFAGRAVVLVYEAGPTGYGLYDALSAAGYICLVVAPALVPREPGRRVKTNRLDSRQLAMQLQGVDLRGIRVPAPLYRPLRHLTHQWRELARRQRALKSQIKALLLMESIPYPEGGGGFGRSAQAALRVLPCGAEVRQVVARQLRLLDAVHREQLGLGKEIRAYCRQDPELAESLACVMSVPGIGWVTGAHLVARVGNWRRLTRSESVGAFAGLGLKEWSTGERVRKGGITRRGDRYLRSLLVEAAWRAIRVDAELRSFYDRLVRHGPREGGARRAIVAVARKLAVRAGRMLMERRPYRRAAAA